MRDTARDVETQETLGPARRLEAGQRKDGITMMTTTLRPLALDLARIAARLAAHYRRQLYRRRGR